jgi:carbon storage regulator
MEVFMLVLSRKRGESIRIGDGIVITVLDVRPSRTRIGIDAPRSVRVQREEVRSTSAVVPLAETIDVGHETVDLREDLVNYGVNPGALGGLENRKVMLSKI